MPVTFLNQFYHLVLNPIADPRGVTNMCLPNGTQFFRFHTFPLKSAKMAAMAGKITCFLAAKVRWFFVGNVLAGNWVPCSFFLHSRALADLHTKLSGARPLWHPILSFSHTFSPKSICVRGPCPPKRVQAPLREILDPPLQGVRLVY